MTAEAPLTERELGRSAAQGARSIATGRLVAEAVGFASSIIVARHVPPSEFGSAAIALIVFSVGVQLTAAGFGAYLIQRERIDSGDAAAASTLSFVTGALLAVAVVVFALTAAPAVFNARTAELFVLAAPMLVLFGVAGTSMALLSRALSWRRIALFEAVAGVVGSVVAAALAVAGLGGTAVVLGLLASATTTAVNALRATGWPGLTRDLRRLREALRFGSRTAGAALLKVAERNVDYAAVGALLSPTSAGIYVRGFQLGVDYQSKASNILLRVALPIFARSSGRDELARLRRRIVRANSVVLVPCLAMLIAVAPVLVPFLYGDRWAPAVVPAQLLALAGVVLVLESAATPLLVAVGRPDLLLRWNAVSLAVFTAAVCVGASIGLEAACIAVVLARVALFCALQGLLIGRVVGVTFRTLLVHDAGPALVASCVLVAVAGTLVATLDDAWPPAAVLAAAGGCGAVAYLVVLRAAFPSALADVRQGLRRG